jgi:hypothetical protein
MNSTDFKLSPAEYNIDSENVNVFVTNQIQAEEVVKQKAGDLDNKYSAFIKYDFSQPFSQTYASDSESEKY